MSEGRPTLIGCSTPRSFNPVSALVRRFTRSEGSHCMRWAGHPDARSFSPKETTPQDLLNDCRQTGRSPLLDTRRWA